MQFHVIPSPYELRPGRAYLRLRLALAYQYDLWRARLRWCRYGFEGSPIVFGNAMAKSGSKLLLQIFQGLHRVGPFAPVKRWPIRMITQDGRVRSEDEVARDLTMLEPGDMALGYVHADNRFLETMTGPDWVTFFLIRDPRDVLVSHMYYATEMYTDHSLHSIYRGLGDYDARLEVEIRGTEGYPYLPDVRTRYERFMGFLDHPSVTVLRFEELRRDLDVCLRRMLAEIRDKTEVDILAADKALPLVRAAIDPGRSPTFRSGAPGAWKDHFKPEHKALFKSVSGDLLQRLGYEESQDW